MKEVLSQNGVEYLYLDITENMLNLKGFLKYRDTADIFAPTRERHGVGLPFIVVKDGDEEKMFLGWEDSYLEQLK